MRTLRTGVINLTALVTLGLSATAVVADERATRIADADYYELPAIWSGLYGGVNLGFATTDHDNGFAGGVQLGYNWQARQIVYGVEGDLSLSGTRSVDSLASLRGRVGYLIDPRLLVYGTAGLGLLNDHGTDAGFVYGLGIEGKINPTMSARLEYLSFNSDSVHGDVGMVRVGVNIKLAP